MGTRHDWRLPQVENRRGITLKHLGQRARADENVSRRPVQLRQAIVGRPEAFATVITERMMTYALGRGLEPADMPVVRRIVRKAGQNDYRLSTIVSEIIESAPFQMRTRLEPGQQGE